MNGSEVSIACGLICQTEGPMLRLFLLSFTVSLGVGYLILRWHPLHARYTGDVALKGSFKVHGGTVSRIGGSCIVLGLLAGVAASGRDYELPNGTILIWLLCLLPAFVGGFAQDLSKRVPTIVRVLAACLSGALAYPLLDAAIQRVEIPGVDALLATPAISFLVTVLAVGLLAHGMNTIDGLNGLMPGVCVIALFALGWVASEVGDGEILLLSGLGVGAGTRVPRLEFPKRQTVRRRRRGVFPGRLCRRSIGAARLPSAGRLCVVSAAAGGISRVGDPLLRLPAAAASRVPASRPDQLHLHTLVYKRVKLPMEDGRFKSRRNCDASVSMLLFASASAFPAVLWWDESLYLRAAALGYVIVYLAIYRRLVRFGAPRKKRSSKLALQTRQAAIRRSR